MTPATAHQPSVTSPDLELADVRSRLRRWSRLSRRGQRQRGREDADGFDPYIYVDATGVVAKWREAVAHYEFVRGGISSFAYLDYFTALATVRGAEARRGQAVAFDIEPIGKRRVLDSLP